jgi:large subunit ribosomal protein L24
MLKTGQPGRRFIKSRLKVGDPVIVITGKDKGVQKKIEDIDRKHGLVYIEGINLKKHFVRRSDKYPKGAIVSVPHPIHISNVMYYCEKCKKGVRIKVKIEEVDGKKIKKRICARCGRELD